MEYRATVESAIEYGKQEKMDDWIHQYLNAEGKNVPLSGGTFLFLESAGRCLPFAMPPQPITATLIFSLIITLLIIIF